MLLQYEHIFNLKIEAKTYVKTGASTVQWYSLVGMDFMIIFLDSVCVGIVCSVTFPVAGESWNPRFSA